MQEDEEIEKLKQEIEELRNQNLKQKELKELREKHRKLMFRTKHPKLLNITGGLEHGVKRMFGSIGSGLKKAGKALEKSDSYIAKKQAEEKALKNKTKSKSTKDEINDALSWMD